MTTTQQTSTEYTMPMDLYRQSGALVMCLQDATMQAAIDGDHARHDRLERIFHKAIDRHKRREHEVRT